MPDKLVAKSHFQRSFVCRPSDYRGPSIPIERRRRTRTSPRTHLANKSHFSKSTERSAPTAVRGKVGGRGGRGSSRPTCARTPVIGAAAFLGGFGQGLAPKTDRAESCMHCWYNSYSYTTVLLLHGFSSWQLVAAAVRRARTTADRSMTCAPCRSVLRSNGGETAAVQSAGCMLSPAYECRHSQPCVCSN